MKYEVRRTLVKIVKYSLLIGIPFLATEYPDLYAMPLGMVLVAIYDWVKHKAGLRLP